MDDMQSNGLKGPATFSSVPPRLAPSALWQSALHQGLATGKRLERWGIKQKWEPLLVIFFTGVAAFLRVYRIAELPPGFHGDEALTGLDALRILDEGWIGPYVSSALGQPTGPLYFTAFIFKLSEASLFTVRLSMAILAIATVPLAYLLFRMSFGRLVAIFSVVALIFSYWHLHYSRVGLMVISMPLIITLASITTLWAIRSAAKWAWLLAGLMLGAGVYTYNAYPMFLVAVAAFLAVHLALHRIQWRELLLRYLLLGFGLVLIALPLIQFAIQSPEFYLSHAREVSLLKDPRFTDADSAAAKVKFVGSQVEEAVSVFFRHPAIDYTDATGGRGTLDPVLAVLAYLGLGLTLARWRSPQHLLAGLAIIAAMVATALTSWGFGGDFRRSLIAVPFVYAVAGIAARDIVSLGQRFVGAGGRQVALTGVIAALLASLAWNSWYYFGEFPHQDTTRWVFVGDLVGALATADRFNPPGTIYFYAGRWSYNYETRLFLYPDTPGVDRSKEFGVFSLAREHPGPVTYVLLPPYVQELDRLKEMYPGGVAALEQDENGGIRFAVYHLQ